MAYERLVRKMTKENLWLYILSLLREKPRYAYELRGEIERKFNFKPGQVTSYLVFYALEREGYIVARGREPSSRGPRRKYYTITAAGRELFEKAEAFIESTKKKLFSI